jgi:hypothetical protein
MNFKLLTVSALVAASLSTASHGAEKINQQIADKAAAATKEGSFVTEVSGLLNDHIRLGTAYNTKTHEFMNVQTVGGNVNETLGNTEAQFKTVIDGNYDETLEALNGNVDIDITFPVVRVDAGAHLAKEMSSTEFSNSYTLQAYLTPKKRTLQPVNAGAGYVLTSAGDTLADNYQGELMKVAGDAYISSIEYGAQLLVNMKIEYLSEQHKSEIGGYLGVEYGSGNIGIDVKGELSYVDSDLKKSVRITVRAVQKGGDPTQLLNIIPDNIISCSLDNYEPCFTLFEQASNYAKNDFDNQFNSLSDYNVVRYTATPYGISSLDVRRLDSGDQDIRYETKYRTLWLENEFKTAIGQELRARSVLAKYGTWMTAAQRDQAESVKAAAYNNAWIYNEYALACRDNPYGTACANNWNGYVANCGNTGYLPCTQTVVLSDLNIVSESLSPFLKCEAAREAAANFGHEVPDTTLGLRNLSLAPVFMDPTDLNSGVLTWTDCSLALNSYGSAFE